MVIFEEELSYSEGFKAGINAGKEIGHDEGYSDGFRDGLNDLVDKELGIESKIYRVFGITGEYEDRAEWTVKSFRIERLAKEYVEKLHKFLLENGFYLSEDGKFDTNLGRRERADFKHPLDENFDYGGGTIYGVEEGVLC